MAGLHDLAGKVAVVTGGASGIGLGIVRRLRVEGMTAVIADIESDALVRAAAETDAIGIRTDVSSPDSVEALAAEVVRRFDTVHLLCNNAGVGSMAPIAGMTPSDWRWLLDVNVGGVANGVRAFLPLLEANADGGHIVNTSSMAGLSVLPFFGGYSVTKFAIVALSEALALELVAGGSKVGVTLLCPGPVRSRLGASSRNRPAALGGGALADLDLEAEDPGEGPRWIDPDAVGEAVVRAVRRGDLYAFTHPEMAPQVAERFARLAEAFRLAAEDAG